MLRSVPPRIHRVIAKLRPALLRRRLSDVSGPTDPQTGENVLQTEMRGIIEALYGPSVRRLPGLDIGRAYRGAEGSFRYGGDVVDVFHFGAGKTAVAVVDITGHGMPAARNAGLAKHALRGYASLGLSARDCVRALNRLCIANSAFEGNEEFFATLFFGIIAPGSRSMEYVSAGHDGAFVVTPVAANRLDATGPIIGLMDNDAAFDHDVVALCPADVLAVATDGFSEARNAAREFLGTDAIADVILDNRVRSAERQSEALVQHAYEFASGQLHDDVAALVVKVVAP